MNSAVDQIFAISVTVMVAAPLLLIAHKQGQRAKKRAIAKRASFLEEATPRYEAFMAHKPKYRTVMAITERGRRTWGIEQFYGWPPEQCEDSVPYKPTGHWSGIKYGFATEKLALAAVKERVPVIRSVPYTPQSYYDNEVNKHERR